MQIKNQEHYKSEQEKWFKQEGKYKGKDYYQFKDISFNDWISKTEYKQEQDAWNAMKKSIEKAAKEHPLYNQSYKELPDYHYDSYTNDFIETKYGEKVINMAMNTIRLQSHGH